MKKEELEINPTFKYIMEHRYTKYLVIATIATVIISTVVMLYMVFSFDTGFDYGMLPRM